MSLSFTRTQLRGIHNAAYKDVSAIYAQVEAGQKRMQEISPFSPEYKELKHRTHVGLAAGRQVHQLMRDTAETDND